MDPFNPFSHHLHLWTSPRGHARYNATMIREARWRSGPGEYPPTPLRDDDLEDVDDSASTASAAA